MGIEIEIADRLISLHGAIVAAQGTRTVPDLPISSPAGRDLLKNSGLSTPERPNVVELLCASIERLSLASTDLLRGLALNCRGPTIAIVSVARMLMESPARLAHLADPSVTTIDRVSRMLNETVEELNQWDNHERKLDLAGMSEHDRDMVRADQRNKRRKNESWAIANDVKLVGSGFLKQHRASAQRAIRLCLEEQAKRMGADLAAASNVGLWWYHQASSASHLLPDGLNSFVTVLNPMNAEIGFGISRSQIADAVDAAFHCLVGGHEVEAAYWGWPPSIDVLKEASATFNSLRRMRS